MSFLPWTDIKTEKGSFGYSSFRSDITENVTQGELIYPEICMLELQLLTVGSPSLDVLTHVFQNFLKVIRLKEKNATLLIHQVNKIKVLALITINLIYGMNHKELLFKNFIKHYSTDL